MQKYTYIHVTESRFSEGEQEYFLQQGNVYELPSESLYIRSLIAQGYLIPFAPKNITKQSKTGK